MPQPYRRLSIREGGVRHGRAPRGHRAHALLPSTRPGSQGYVRESPRTRASTRGQSVVRTRAEGVTAHVRFYLERGIRGAHVKINPVPHSRAYHRRHARSCTLTLPPHRRSTSPSMLSSSLLALAMTVSNSYFHPAFPMTPRRSPTSQKTPYSSEQAGGLKK